MTNHQGGSVEQTRDNLADHSIERVRLQSAALMTGMGIAHFVVPRPFERIVPRWFPWRREAVLWSGAAELSAGLLLANRRTHRVGAWLMLVTVVAVYPANVQMALDASAGRPQVKVPAWLLWARLPMQIPLIVRAWGLTR